MLKLLPKISYWCVVATLYCLGGNLATGGINSLRWEVILPWLQSFGLPLVLLVTAAVLTAIPLTKWVLDRRYALDLQKQVRANLTIGSFREIDASVALAYLLKESVWGWKQYARMNFWENVGNDHLEEFRRAALAGTVLVVGVRHKDNKAVVIDRRLWANLVINPITIASPHAVEAGKPGKEPFLNPPAYTALAIPAADLRTTWPEASAARRAVVRSWLWLKKGWFGSLFSVWLEPKR